MLPVASYLLYFFSVFLCTPKSPTKIWGIHLLGVQNVKTCVPYNFIGVNLNLLDLLLESGICNTYRSC